MNAKTVGEILDVLAARLGTTAAHLWEVLVRQVYVEAAFNGALAVVLIGLVVALGRWARRLYASEDYGDDMTVGVTVLAVAAVIFAGVATVIAIGSTVQLLNPEYGALKLIGEAIGGAK